MGVAHSFCYILLLPCITLNSNWRTEIGNEAKRDHEEDLGSSWDSNIRHILSTPACLGVQMGSGKGGWLLGLISRVSPLIMSLLCPYGVWSMTLKYHWLLPYNKSLCIHCTCLQWCAFWRRGGRPLSLSHSPSQRYPAPPPVQTLPDGGKEDMLVYAWEINLKSSTMWHTAFGC